jgi:TRAP-type C4-dicarboxylate transport system substrate-binding protein
MKRIARISLVLGLIALFALPVFAGGGKESAPAAKAEVKPVKLVGGVMLPEGHVYWQTVVKFRDLLKQYYSGPVEVDLHHSGSLGTEKDAIEYMIQGTAVDFYIISPAWIATWDKTAPFIDAPFIFKSISHWEKCLEANVFKPIEDNLITKGVRFLGHGGGGVRSIISKKPASSINDFPNIQMRVQGSPLHQKAFTATGLKATPMDYMEVYNAIKTGVLDALENEPAGLEGMKFYEVAPFYILTQHQITTRQLAMSEKKFQSMPKPLQDAVLKAGKEAAAFHRKTEVALGETIIKNLTEKHGLKPLPFDNTEMRKRAMPAVEAYAKEVGAYEMFKAIEAIN